jgi:hypothetical protein
LEQILRCAGLQAARVAVTLALQCLALIGSAKGQVLPTTTAKTRGKIHYIFKYYRDLTQK